jgi:hypothetical protein
MKIKKINKQPAEIRFAYLQSVLMPNGEVICNGKTVGWYKDLSKYLFTNN